MSAPEKNRRESSEKVMRSVYVCPKTRRPSSEDVNGLTRDDCIHYRFIKGWNDTPIPDFLNAYELGHAGKKSLEMYNQTASVEQYRNFLDWLFQTFNKSQSSFRRDLVGRLRLDKGGTALVTGCVLRDEIPPMLGDLSHD